MFAYGAGQNPAENEEEELDEDIAVTQSQTNFICPLTQVHTSSVSRDYMEKDLNGNAMLFECTHLFRCILFWSTG